ncbi:hypothetical protein HJG54_31415 [Leptolyngbya sp. NK1-12]|uniref:Uncharacterized protein n=1 Tax=Leptolyngbya sp. NK1-12 TaxID=2547451 RepID=A0AA96WLJ6_9CYAN|nr:hypothetical protein [Leptolyngbya sp. NK1-12]WNZ27394.1 hypothetical protein HJG54_31415 [Leptolyngbya sp. NK1-12]
MRIEKNCFAGRGVVPKLAVALDQIAVSIGWHNHEFAGTKPTKFLSLSRCFVAGVAGVAGVAEAKLRRFGSPDQ